MQQFLSILGAIGLLGAALIIWQASKSGSAIHEIEAILSLILTAICWSGAGIMARIDKLADK
jgi:hypothetical protein